MLQNSKSMHIITLNLAKRLQGATFKTRAPRAMKLMRHEIAIAFKVAEDSIVFNQDVNQYVWSQGIRTTPRKIRISIEKQADKTIVGLVPVASFKGLNSEKQE